MSVPCLRVKEENFENVSFESLKPASGNWGYGPEDSNTAKWNDKPSSKRAETAIRTTLATSSRSYSTIGHSQCTKKIPRENSIWDSIPGCQKCRKNSTKARISKCVTNMVRHHDQFEREAEGAMHWDVILPVLKERLQIQMEKEFTNEDWLNCFYLGSFKTRCEICKDEDGELEYIRAIQGHSGGIIVPPRLMNNVMIPHKWKEFFYHVGRARDQYSIAETGLVAGEKNEKKDGKQFSSLLSILWAVMPTKQN